MTATVSDASLLPGDVFRHEALLYSGESAFAGGTLPFLRDAVARGEPVLAVVSAPKIRLLRSALGGDGERVHFADMAEVGHNPARIIPAWRAFLDDHAPDGRRVRGIGEPIWAGRSPAELVECQRHEALLNVAFDGAPAWWLLCPYDTDSLDRSVIDEAHRSHPYVLDEGGHRDSPTCRGGDMPASHLDAPLPEPARALEELTFGPGGLGLVRRLVSTHARRYGVDRGRADDLVLAVNEIATNSLCHGGGRGMFRVWRDGRNLVCEVSDGGRIEDPLVGRQRPATHQDGGRGLWLANQLCDLVQIRSFAWGSVVRLHAALDGA